jgi:hypothetical protein
MASRMHRSVYVTPLPQLPFPLPLRPRYTTNSLRTFIHCWKLPHLTIRLHFTPRIVSFNRLAVIIHSFPSCNARVSHLRALRSNTRVPYQNL